MHYPEALNRIQELMQVNQDRRGSRARRRVVGMPERWQKLTYGRGDVNWKRRANPALLALIPRDPVESRFRISSFRLADLMDRNRGQLEERIVRQEYPPGVKHPRDIGEATSSPAGRLL